jgi:hypothetical protein
MAQRMVVQKLSGRDVDLVVHSLGVEATNSSQKLKSKSASHGQLRANSGMEWEEQEKVRLRVWVWMKELELIIVCACQSPTSPWFICGLEGHPCLEGWTSIEPRMTIPS